MNIRIVKIIAEDEEETLCIQGYLLGLSEICFILDGRIPGTREQL